MKVPKCEIFNHSVCHDFHTIKSSLVGDFGVEKMYIYKKYFRVPLGPQSSFPACAYAQPNFKDNFFE